MAYGRMRRLSDVGPRTLRENKQTSGALADVVLIPNQADQVNQQDEVSTMFQQLTVIGNLGNDPAMRVRRMA